MANNLFIPQKLRPWIEARRTFHLGHAQVQMARLDFPRLVFLPLHAREVSNGTTLTAVQTLGKGSQKPRRAGFFEGGATRTPLFSVFSLFRVFLLVYLNVILYITCR
jgi:hypothetical protein